MARALQGLEAPPEINVGAQKWLTDDRAEVLAVLFPWATKVELRDFGNTLNKRGAEAMAPRRKPGGCAGAPRLYRQAAHRRRSGGAGLVAGIDQGLED